MRSYKMKFILPVLALAFFAGCEEEDFRYETEVTDVQDITRNSAEFKGYYWVVGTRFPVNETGFRYRVVGDDDGEAWVTVKADMASAADFTFSYSCDGLEPGTRYEVGSWIKVGMVYYESRKLREFTTEPQEGGGEEEGDFSVAMSSVTGVTDTGATFQGTYTLGDGQEVTAAGFKYRTGSGNWTTVTAAGTSTPFSYTCGGLVPETLYSVTAWAEVGGTVRESSAASTFTTAAGGTTGPVAGGWAELPVMDNMPNVVYVTHYVTESGKKIRNYTLCYDKQNRQAWWAAFPMHPFYDGGAGRNEAWKYDPEISTAWQPNLSSSYNGSYSRGHQVASSDRQRSKAMNQQTFYYSNMAPQIQNEFNGGIWNDLEKKVQAIGYGWNDTLYVVTGEAFIGSHKTTTDKSNNVIPVPTHFYKVLLSSKSGNTKKPIGQLKADELRCVGFWFDHFAHGTKDKVSASNMKSVADIEELTGFTFFPMLSEEAKSVKQTYSAGDWAGF